jgi:four helix bundle protein
MPALADSVSPEQLRQRTFAFAIAVYRFAKPHLRALETRHAAGQLIRASSSVASNYRASCLARSHAEWLAKIGVVREESDESLFWLLYSNAIEAAPRQAAELDGLTREARELTQIFMATWQSGRRQDSREK